MRIDHAAYGPTSPTAMREVVLALVRRGEFEDADRLAELMICRTASFSLPPLGTFEHAIAVADRDTEYAYWYGTHRALLAAGMAAVRSAA